MYRKVVSSNDLTQVATWLYQRLKLLGDMAKCVHENQDHNAEPKGVFERWLRRCSKTLQKSSPYPRLRGKGQGVGGKRRLKPLSYSRIS